MQNAGWTFQGTTGIRLWGSPCKGVLFAGALGTTGDFMFDFSTGAGVPLAHWDITGRLFNRYYVQTYRRVTLSRWYCRGYFRPSTRVILGCRELIKLTACPRTK